jgi:hypothetical protein
MKPLTNLKHRRLRLAFLAFLAFLSAFCRFPAKTWKAICATCLHALTRCKSAWNEQRKAAASHEQARLARLSGRPLLSLLPRDKWQKAAQENHACALPGIGPLRATRSLR